MILRVFYFSIYPEAYLGLLNFLDGTILLFIDRLQSLGTVFGFISWSLIFVLTLHFVLNN